MAYKSTIKLPSGLSPMGTSDAALLLAHHVQVSEDDTTRLDEVLKSLSGRMPTVGLAYQISADGKYYICTGVGNAIDSDIVIASQVGTIPVTAIAPGAFEGALMYNDLRISTVVIPDTVTTIGHNAFAENYDLYRVHIPSSVTYVGENAFCQLATGNTQLRIFCGGTEKQAEAWSSEWAFTCSNKGIKIVWNYVSTTLTAQTDDLNKQLRKAQRLSTEGLEYSINGSEAYCEGVGTINDNDIIIDSKYKELPVTKISESAFAECTQLTSVVIPDSVTNILDMAFWSCSNLKNITLSKNVTNIGESTFGNCTALESIVIPASVLYMYEGTFSNCPNLTIYCEAESQPADWEDGWNGGCPVVWGYAPDIESVNTKLKKLANSSGSSGTGDATGREPSVGCSYSLSADGTQYSCTGVRRQNLVDTVDVVIASEIDGIPVTSINAEAFKDNKYIKSVYMPDSITSIGSSAFWGCSDLTNVTISDSVASIGDNAFYNCYNLTSITIPDSVTSIGNYAFDHCSNLTSVTIGNGVTSIGAGAFYTCTSLPLVTIPKSVTSIGGYAFEKCTNLTIYCKTESKPNGWSDNWNIDNRPVVWGWINDFEGVNEKFNKLEEQIAEGGTGGASVSTQAENLYHFSNIINFFEELFGEEYNNRYTMQEILPAMYAYFRNKNIDAAKVITYSNEYDGVYIEGIEGANNQLTISYFRTYLDDNSIQALFTCEVKHIGAFTDGVSIEEIGDPPIADTRMDAYYEEYADVWKFGSWDCPGEIVKENIFYVSDKVYRVEKRIGEHLLHFQTFDDLVDYFEREATVGAVVGASYTAKELCQWIKRYLSETVGYGTLKVIFKDGCFENNNRKYTFTNGLADWGEYTITAIHSYTDDNYDVCDFHWECHREIWEIPIVNADTIREYDSLVKYKKKVVFHQEDGWQETDWYSPTQILAEEIANAKTYTDEKIAEISNSAPKPTEGLMYTLSSDGTYYVCSSRGEVTDTDIVIASEIDGIPVKEIGGAAFMENTIYRSISIPDSVTKIGDYAFCDCDCLTNIIIPDSVTSIGTHAFYDCYELANVIIGKNVASMGSRVFDNCSQEMNFYCKADSQPADWEDGWNGGCPVVWGYIDNFDDVNDKFGNISTALDGIIAIQNALIGE